MTDDPVDHPSHYTSHPSGVECITITEAFDFCTGNAIKYLWRAGLKDSDNPVQDLKKARWYVQRLIDQAEPEPEPETGWQVGDRVSVFPGWTLSNLQDQTFTFVLHQGKSETPYVSPYPDPPCVECGDPADGLTYCKECCA